MPYQYLLFDADNTLLDFAMAEYVSFREMCAVLGIHWTEEAYRVYSEINDAFWKRLEKGEITASVLRVKRFEVFLEWEGLQREKTAVGPELPARMNKIYMENVQRQSFLMPRAKEVCGALAQKYPLYIVTNGLAKAQRSRLADAGLDIYFRKLYISEEIGSSKPATDFFAAVMQDIGDPDPSHYLVIGDSLTSDIDGASGAGMDSVWLCEEGAD